MSSGRSDVLERLAHRFPSLLVDTVGEHEPGKRLVAFKNVTVNEDFFQGHFPHKPLMPAVLMIEALTQVATLLLLDRDGGAPGKCPWKNSSLTVTFLKTTIRRPGSCSVTESISNDG